MARRRTKKRTHVGANNATRQQPPVGHASGRDPKSMVIRIGAGEVGSNISQLARDVRQVMEPGTATRLQERRANRLRDYVTMCGPLGVTHLLLFSRSESGNTNLRVALAPRGPTLHFRVEQYSLARDVRRSQRRPKGGGGGGGKEYRAPPLLVMNNFSSPSAGPASAVPKHLESLTTTVFQSLFPPINPQTTPLRSIRRVLLLNREPSPPDENSPSFVVNFRHYAISTRTAGVSGPLRRLDAADRMQSSSSSSSNKTKRKGGVPNLGRLGDIADYMIGGADGDGYHTDGTSGSEVDTDNEVEVLDAGPRRVLLSSRRAQESLRQASRQDVGDTGVVVADDDDDDKAERRAVKLVELGPRLKLRLTKVEEGLCAGKVMWHEYLHKSPQEIKNLEKRWEQRRREKEVRRKQQRANVAKKQAGRRADGAGNLEYENGDEEESGDLAEYDGHDSDLFDDMMDVDANDGLDDENLEGGGGGDGEAADTPVEADGEWEDDEEEPAEA